MKPHDFVPLLCLVSIALSASSASAAEPALIGHWKLAGNAEDSSGHGRHAENRGADLRAPGPDDQPGGAAGFDGRDDLLEIPAGRLPPLGTGNFSIAVRVHTAAAMDDLPGDILSQYDPARRRGFSLGITSNFGVTTNQANYRNLHFGIDDDRIESAWTDHGRPGKALIPFALTVYRGQLFAGTCEPGRDEAGHVYRLSPKGGWIDCGSPHPSNSVSALAVYNGQLYAGVSKYRVAGSALQESENTTLGGKVFRYDGDGAWIDCGKLGESEAIGGLCVYRGQLYATSLYKPAGFFRYAGDQNWTALDVPDGKRVEAMGVFNGQIFASSYDAGRVFRYDGNRWTDCGQVGSADDKNSQTYSFVVHFGRLYVGTWPSGKVYRYEEDDRWTDVGRLGQELEVMGMLVHNGSLFAGSLPLAEVYRFDGKRNWQRLAQLDLTPDVKYRRAWTMAEFQGRLYCGVLPTGKVWSVQAGNSVTFDDELQPGWRHIVATRDGERLRLYVDGRSVAESTPFRPGDLDLTTDRPLQIGFGPHDYFQGRLRDLRLYSRALTAAEIARLAGE